MEFAMENLAKWIIVIVVLIVCLIVIGILTGTIDPILEKLGLTGGFI